jgi:hypothetical protein
MTSKLAAVLLTLAVLLVVPAVVTAAGSPEILVSTGPAVRNLSNSNPRMTVFPDGGFVVVWNAYNPRAPQAGIYARFFSADGRPASRAFRLVERTGRDQFAAQVEADGNGSFLLVWNEQKPTGRNGRDVLVRRFNRQGTPLGDRIVVHEPSDLDRSLPYLAVAPDGRFAVAWSALFDAAGSTSETRIRVFSRRGRPLTGEILAATGVSRPELTTYAFPAGLAWTPDGSLALLYGINSVPDGNHIWIVRVELDGRTTERRQLTREPMSVLGDFGWSLAKAEDGTLFAAWGEDALRAQRFGPDVRPIGESFLLSDSPRVEAVPKILPLADRTFLATWSDREGRDGDDGGIYGRLFAFDGTPLSRVFRINRTTAGYQDEAFPAAGRRRPAFVVWTTEVEQSDLRQIVLRRLPFGN